MPKTSKLSLSSSWAIPDSAHNQLLHSSKELLEAKDCSYRVKPLQEEAMGLSKLAHGLDLLASGHTTGEEPEDEEDQDVKKRRRRGRAMSM